MSKSLKHVLHYNENKVKEGVAECIAAVGFGTDASDLSVAQKRARFEKLTVKNRISKTNIAHIALSFAPGEQLDNEKLVTIASSYLAKTGFGEQPFLVYLHKDTGNQHIHIVSTNIRSDGSRIATHRIGATKGAIARREIEQDFGLVKAEGKGAGFLQGIPPLDLEQYLQAGKKQKASISAIIRAVISKYKFCSLAEYNAILKQFNVVADPGQPDSLLRARGGLLYSAINAAGTKVGAQIRASSIYVHGWNGLPDNAGLKLLTGKFKEDRARKIAFRPKLASQVEAVLDRGVTMSGLIRALKAAGITVSTRYNEQGHLSGITFVDNRQAVAFKGSDLRKSLGAAGVAARLLTASKIQRALNRDIVRSVLTGTDFRSGFDKVLGYWRSQGLILEASQFSDGQTIFYLRADHLPPGCARPIRANIDQYLRNNLGRPQGTARAFRMDRQGIEATFHRELSRYSLMGMVRLNVFEELVHAEAPYEGLPVELLKEARKKKRKKR
ncbi:relaxase/mobilization nuclease domain-containing protein [Chitinophaga rhizosphaerae]|uniref:relaxase/mobilization nuclease domain-containing protein n=1 Tax=Chitinophaga rhizosphaerae TaxID=1864947 RepID=UPI000F80CCDE|nr:relaxase/mobilization nuclease domain-containing protein [Chitinophaga rhizosphaerae]